MSETEYLPYAEHRELRFGFSFLEIGFRTLRSGDKIPKQGIILTRRILRTKTAEHMFAEWLEFMVRTDHGLVDYENFAREWVDIS